jgi:hypothetical protein
MIPVATAATGQWSHVSQQMAGNHSDGVLITIGEHYLVAFGGGWPLLPITDIEILNASSSETFTNGWIKAKVPLQYDDDGVRDNFAACVRNHFDLYVIGGDRQDHARPLRSMIRCRFTPQSLISMTPTQPAITPISDISSSSSKSSVGHSNDNTTRTANTQSSVDSDLIWERCSPLPVSISYITAVSVRAGIIVIGEVSDHPEWRRDKDTGERVDVHFTLLYLYRTDTNKWSPLGTPLEIPSPRHASTVIIDPYSGDECLVITGYNDAWTINITATIASTINSSISASSSAAVPAAVCQWIRLPTPPTSSSLGSTLVPFETI